MHFVLGKRSWFGDCENLKFLSSYLQSVPLVVIFSVIVFEYIGYGIQFVKKGVWVYLVVAGVCVINQLPCVVDYCCCEGVLVFVKGVQ